MKIVNYYNYEEYLTDLEFKKSLIVWENKQSVYVERLERLLPPPTSWAGTPKHFLGKDILTIDGSAYYSVEEGKVLRFDTESGDWYPVKRLNPVTESSFEEIPLQEFMERGPIKIDKFLETNNTQLTLNQNKKYEKQNEIAGIELPQ